jgi:hypothetical protein
MDVSWVCYTLRLKQRKELINISAALMSALASCGMGQVITSEVIAMVNSNSRMDECPVLLSRSIWVTQKWKVALHGFGKVGEEKKLS